MGDARRGSRRPVRRRVATMRLLLARPREHAAPRAKRRPAGPRAGRCLISSGVEFTLRRRRVNTDLIPSRDLFRGRRRPARERPWARWLHPRLRCSLQPPPRRPPRAASEEGSPRCADRVPRAPLTRSWPRATRPTSAARGCGSASAPARTSTRRSKASRSSSHPERSTSSSRALESRRRRRRAAETLLVAPAKVG
jgi:hypothetical protein